MSGLNADSPPDAVLLYDRKENHNGEGRNVLFVDGHVEWMSEEEFRKKGTEKRGRVHFYRAHFGSERKMICTNWCYKSKRFMI